MNKNTKLILVSGLFLSLPILLVTTDPSKLALPLLMLPFIILFISIFVAVSYVLKKFLGVGDAKRKAVSGMMAGGPVMLLVFQSLHQLSATDVLITMALLVGFAFYVSRIDFAT